MIRKCANPSCLNLFLDYRGGRVLLINLAPDAATDEVESWAESSHLEYFWLCEQCAPSMTVVSDPGGAAIIKQLGNV